MHGLTAPGAVVGGMTRRMGWAPGMMLRAAPTGKAVSTTFWMVSAPTSVLRYLTAFERYAQTEVCLFALTYSATSVLFSG
jgi:hypothetical protein